MATVHPDPVIWFAGMGFRPAVWTPPHRHDEVDPPRLVPAPDSDTPFLAKYDTPTGYAWGTWIPAPVTDAPQITAASLAGPVTPWHPATPTQPWQPSEPEWPCCVIREPDYPMPLPAPVPVPASGVLLACAVAALVLMRRRG